MGRISPRPGFGGSRAPSLALAGVLVLLTAGGSLATVPHGSAPLVTAISQSGYTNESGRFTVTVQVASASGIQGVYFSFCQLSSPVCYNPVTMALQGTNTYVGTTNVISNYHTLKVGALAGYNITIALTNNTTVHYPSFPNAFSTLTIGTEVGGEYMFEMTVSNFTYGLHGSVTDASTHSGLAGADVTLTPGNGTAVVTTSAGDYSFGGLANGTYTVSVSVHGYPTATDTVTIAGGNGVKDIALSNGTAPPPQKSSASNGLGFLGTTTGLVVLAVAIAAIAGAALLLYSRRRGGGNTPDPVK